MAKVPDLSTSIAALASDDVQAVLSSLSTLLASDVRGFPQTEQQALNMTGKVLTLLSSSNASVRVNAAKLAARMAQQFGALQASMRSHTFLQALWSIISEFGSNFIAYQAALAQIEQPSQADASKKPPSKAAAPVAPVDLEATLPVPSKQLLEAALRCLTSLAVLSHAPAVWISHNSKVELLLLLLQHHSLRVQLRALHCIKAMCTSLELCNQLLMHGLVQGLFQLLHTTNSGAVMINTTQLLLHLCQQGPGPQLVQIVEQAAVDTLLQLVLSPESTPCRKDASADPDAAPLPTPTAVDFAKLMACRPNELQVSAAALLHHLVVFNPDARAQLSNVGAPNLLLAMLPSAQKVQASEPVGIAQPEQKPAAPFFPPGAVNPEAESVLEKMDYALPTSKASSHQLQAFLLEILSVLLADADIQQAVWQASERYPLIPFLTYFLSEPDPAQTSETATPAETVSADTTAKGKGAKDPKGKPMSARSAARAAAAEQLVNAPDVKVPPFPPQVKVAALHCLTQLARHPDLAAMLRLEPGVKALVPAAAAAARTNEASKPPQSEQAAASPAVSEPLGPAISEAAATLLQLLLTEDNESRLFISHKEMVTSSKGLAATVKSHGSVAAQSNVVRMVLLLPEADLIAPARPPPPSPPKTPPPLPLATSQFVWDALGRPSMTDGSNVKLVHVS